ncbi:MAG: four helix bundle protein [Candidatus Doudnabacteria bacterium]|nr:four helix bundle protein [Candidatus Doudnabacteria bacterium]
MTRDELKERTKKFAVRIVKLVQYLEKNHGLVVRKIGDQILRSGTDIYSNYRAACRSKLPKDFILKMGTVVKEPDETLGWLELMVASNILNEVTVESLLKEADELTAVMTASRSTSISKHSNNF